MPQVYNIGLANKPDIGRDSSSAAKAAEVLNRRMFQFKLDDSEQLKYHNESVIRDREIVGYLTSGMYVHAVGGALGMGYTERKCLG